MIDPQYVVGFNWERQYGARVVKNFGDKFAFGVSAENPRKLRQSVAAGSAPTRTRPRQEA